jgi:hypothetical protein
MTVPTGELGIHTFTSGYYYGSRFVDFDQELGITINMEPFRDPKPAAPTIASPELSPATVAPGEVFVVRADVKAGNAKDPLSEEVIVIHPRSGTSRALDPPSAGVQGKAYPDGIWKTTLTAPSEPGTYEYFLAATSEGCVTSDIPPALVLQVQ